MGKRKYTKEQLIEILRDYIKEYGIPKSKDFTAKNGLPANELYRRYFGSWYESLLLAGVEIPEDRLRFYQNDRLNDEKLLNDLKLVTENHLIDNMFLLNSTDFIKYNNIQSYSAYERRFGSIENTYELIGYDYKEFNNKRLEENMLLKLKEINDILGRTPNTYDLNNFSQTKEGYYSASAYDHHFGNISNSLKLVGLRPTQSSITRNMSEDDLIRCLRDFYNKYNRFPSQPDTYEEINMPVYTTYVKKFGSWDTALKKAFGNKFRIRRVAKQMITKNGVKCKSMLEYLFATMLEEHNIDFKLDKIYYRDFISDYKGGYRFDFLIKINNQNIFIEIFGFMGKQFKSQIKYAKDKDVKIKLCKDSNLTLLSFYPHDIYRKSTDKIYEIFKNKLKEVS